MNSMDETDFLERGEARVLRTSGCACWMSHLTEFENAHFGPDFSWSVEQNTIWAASGAAFQSAIIRGSPKPHVSASMSAFVTSRESVERLVAGDAKECDLLPWNHGESSREPVLYFASVISSVTEELPFLYGSLAQDISEYVDEHELRLGLGVAIAGSALGKQHLEYNGFCALKAKYLDKYPFMGITARHARTPFWQRLLTHTPKSLALFLHEQIDPVRSG